MKWRDGVQEYVWSGIGVKDSSETLSRQEGSVKIVRDGSSSAVAIPWWEQVSK